MSNARPQVEVAISEFRKFLKTQDWPEKIIWLTKRQILIMNKSYYIYKPIELNREKDSLNFYELIRATNSSIRIDGLSRNSTYTFAYIENYGGENALLNFGVWENKYQLVIISSLIRWFYLKFILSLRGGSPILRELNIST
jgi:hypothetical protein